ncbi:hypothetical protein [Haladaptatus halobius]|uniref:hypothetical protein n=1 Tax=Haladaptatus halobius TaxID=2884875 RepID=UPI001D0B9933|nr:hypothetical protein [Haladaptatus halobius]
MRSDRLDRIERGLDLLFSTEIAKEILDSVDVEALDSGASFDEAVDYERLGEILGSALGHGLTKQLLDRVASDRFVTRVVGSSVAGRLGAMVVRELLDRTDPEELLTWLTDLADEESFDADDAIPIPVESDGRE